MKNTFPFTTPVILPNNQLYRNITTFTGFPHWLNSEDINIQEFNNSNLSNSKYDTKKPLKIIRWKNNFIENKIPDKQIANYFFRLRINRTFSKSHNKSLISSSQAVYNILSYSDVKFGLIYTTNSKFFNYLNNNFRGRYDNITFCNQNFIDRVYMHTKFARTKSDVAAEVYIPSETDLVKPSRVLAFDGLCYSQNVGMLLRTAIALGFDGLFILNNSAKQFDWKVTCITKGFQFILPYKTGNSADLVMFCKEKNLIPLVAHVDGIDLREFKLNPDCGFCLIMGSEGKGPSKEILEFSQKITLPGHPLINSLNVAIAGGILMHQLSQLINNCQQTTSVY